MLKIASLVLLTALASPAFAQQTETATTANSGFTGPRIEARVGFQRLTFDVNVTGTKGSAHRYDFAYGGEAGFDGMIGNSALVGGYVGIDGGTIRQCEVDGTEETCLRDGRNLTAGGRIGFVAGSNALVYAKGGYSNGRLTATYTDSAFPADNVRGSSNRGGWHIGAGAEVKASDTGYFKLEYVHTNYNGATFRDGTDFISLDAHRDQVMLGFGLRF
jgi:outer membrane immunogenic protein